MSKTLHFDTYEQFLQREDKAFNGTSGPSYEKDDGNVGCWECSDCARCSECSDCSDCFRCSGCSDCSGCVRCYDCARCSDCSDCSECSDCIRCSDCTRCARCSRCSRCSDCRDIETAEYACLIGLYKYVCSPRINKDGTQWIQMGCHLRTRKDWEAVEWNNPLEFPNDQSFESTRRHFALQIAYQWLDRQLSAKR